MAPGRGKHGPHRAGIVFSLTFPCFHAPMRPVLLVLMSLLAACEAAPFLLAADAASVVVFGRGVGDIGVSAITGRDCSIVRLDRGLTYCADTSSPVPARLCTRTLATVDCWTETAAPPGRRTVADAPEPTAAQARYRAAPWPKSLTALPWD